jgi:hypothetical protein
MVEPAPLAWGGQHSRQRCGPRYSIKGYGFSVRGEDDVQGQSWSGAEAMGAHTLSREQTRAVRAVMRMFAEEDLAHGVPRRARRLCQRCHRERPAAGFIHCNTCATAFELARLRHTASTITDWLKTTGC